MSLDRRTTLRLAGLGLVGTLAGCLGDPGSDPSNDDTSGRDDSADGTDATVTDYDTAPYLVGGAVPAWDGDETTGHAVVIDSEERQRAVLRPGDLDDDRRDALGEFLDGIDYETERLLVVESAGPNTCYRDLDVSDVRVDGGRLRADVVAVDTSKENEACGEAITYPSVLLRVTFEPDPVNEVELSITDGWGTESTVSASADDALSPDAADLDGYVRPDGDPEPVEPLVCEEDGVERLGSWADAVVYGDAESDGVTVAALRVDALEYEGGEEATVRLTNVSDEELLTGNRHKHSLEVYTEDGWQDVRVHPDDRPVAYTDEGVIHPPGEGFEWTFELTAEGVLDGHAHEDVFEVCPGLPAGRYRFSFWDVAGADALAVQFDLVE